MSTDNGLAAARSMAMVVAAVQVTIMAVAPPARAVDPFEIQIYEGDINQPGQSGLEVHANFVPVGQRVAEEPGRLPPDDLFRLTLEPSHGLLEWWEVGAYLQFVLDPADPAGHFGGFKLRSKWIVPRRLTATGEGPGNLVVGLNVEVGRGVRLLGSDSWDTELRPILAWHAARWMVALNPMIGWALSGPDRGWLPDLEPGAKVRVDTGLGVGLGLEYYAGIGPLAEVPGLAEQEHLLYLVGDLIDAAFDLNLGVGRGLTAAANDWTVKAILGLAF